MEPVRIFYSWQSDRERHACGRFISIALEEAIETLQPFFTPRLILDSDTTGVAGTPPVSETILRKIRECDVFVGDVSFVGATSAGKMLPNPNVMTEFGFARGVLDDQRLILVMNTAFGSPRELPFDLAHLRHPVAYELGEGASQGTRRDKRSAFASKLTPALEASIRVAVDSRVGRRVDQDAVIAAEGLLVAIEQLSSRGDVPAIVPGPRLVLRMAPAAAANGPSLEPAKVKSLKHWFVPEGYDRLSNMVDARQWASFDPPRHVGGGHNPEARWYTRLVRPGVLESCITIGARIDDDRTIIVEALPLEGRIVETVHRLASIVAEAGLDGVIIISASLQGLEDVQMMSSNRTSRPLGVPGLQLGTLSMTSASGATALALKPLLDTLWLGCGFEDGSPSFVGDAWAGATEKRRYEPATVGGRAWR